MEAKKQVTIYVTKDDEKRLNDLCFMRSNWKKKATRSELFCEGLQLLHNKDIPKT